METYGELTVLRVMRDHRSDKVAECKCSCGNVKLIALNSLRHGLTKSCGCKRSALISAARRKHGASGSRTYRAWQAMRQRCNDPRAASYPNYGGRGIKVCERWNDFANFLADMGERPTIRYSLDRIDNARGYEPGNCRWATQREQCMNKTNNRLITHNGITQPLQMWADQFGTTEARLRKRLDAGYSMEDALTLPVWQRRPGKTV